MGIVDFILNLAGLLLWLNWRSIRFDPLGKRRPATLLGTLRRAGPQRLRRWHLLAALGGLLFLRAVFYWQFGSAFNPVWAGELDLGVITLSFRSDFFARMLLFSLFSFGLTLGVFYIWLVLLSILAGPEPVHGLVRIQVGRIDRWPRGMKCCLPPVVTAGLWWLASWPLTWLDIATQPVSAAHRLEEALVIGLGSYPVWKYVAVALLVLHLLNTYIYFGKHAFWNYVNTTAQTLLHPLRAGLLGLWRRMLSPLLFRAFRWREPTGISPSLKIARSLLLDVVGIALVFLAAGLVERGLAFLYGQLPLGTQAAPVIPPSF